MARVRKVELTSEEIKAQITSIEEQITKLTEDIKGLRVQKKNLSIFLLLNSLLMGNFHEENKNIEAYVAKYTEAFATTVGMFANEGISELMKYVKENGIKLDLK